MFYRVIHDCLRESTPSTMLGNLKSLALISKHLPIVSSEQKLVALKNLAGLYVLPHGYHLWSQALYLEEKLHQAMNYNHKLSGFWQSQQEVWHD